MIMCIIFLEFFVESNCNHVELFYTFAVVKLQLT